MIQAFTDGEEDHLSVVVERAALLAADLRHGTTVEMDGVTIEVDDEPLAGEVSRGTAVLISRPIEDSIRGQVRPLSRECGTAQARRVGLVRPT